MVKLDVVNSLLLCVSLLLFCAAIPIRCVPCWAPSLTTPLSSTTPLGAATACWRPALWNSIISTLRYLAALHGAASCDLCCWSAGLLACWPAGRLCSVALHVIVLCCRVSPGFISKSSHPALCIAQDVYLFASHLASCCGCPAGVLLLWCGVLCCGVAQMAAKMALPLSRGGLLDARRRDLMRAALQSLADSPRPLSPDTFEIVHRSLQPPR